MFDKFTSTELILIIGAIGTGIGGIIAAMGGLVASIGVIVLQIINARKMNVALVKVEETKETVAKVEGHVNSARTEQATDIKALQAQISEMSSERAKREKEAQELAHARQVNGLIATVAQGAPIPVIVENHPSDPVPTIEK